MTTTSRVLAPVVCLAMVLLGGTAASAVPSTGAISGRVTDTAGDPLAGVEVHVAGEPVLTGADGTYVVSGLSVGQYTVSVWPPDPYLSRYFGDVPYWSGATAPGPASVVAVAAGATRSGVDVVVEKGATITGTVLGPAGQPVAGASVVSETDGAWSAFATTDAAGRYTLSGLHPGSTDVWFKPTASGLAPGFEAGVAAAAGQVTAGVDVQLVAGASISGTVLAPDGRPASGSVQATDVGCPAHPCRGGWALLAPDGSYTMSGLAPGDYVIGALLPGHTELYPGAPDKSGAQVVSVTASSTLTGISWTTAASASIEAHLSDGGDQPAIGQAAEAVSQDDRRLGRAVLLDGTRSSDETGTQLLDGFRAGTSARIVVGRASGDTPYVAQYYVAAGQTTSSFDAATVVPLDADPVTVSMSLRTGATITGVVRGADGTGSAGETVVAFVDDMSLPTRSATTGPDGAYAIRGLLPGTYQVAAAPNGITRQLDTYYLTGTKPSSPNVVVSGTSTTSGIDITVGARFTDVQPTYAFSSYISWLAGRGITTGYAYLGGLTDFRPTAAVSREAMAAFLFRDIAPGGYTPPASARFSDVPTSYPFYTNVAWLAQQGISTGFADGTFKPTDAVTREAMAAFLYRAAGSPAYTPPASPRFSDVPTDYPFYRQISWLAAQGISTGYADGTFKPTAAVTREAMAAFLQRADPIFHPAG